MVVTPGDAIVGSQTVHDKPADGLHINVGSAMPVSIANMLIESPGQIAEGPFMYGIGGTGLTVTVVVLTAVQLSALVTISVYTAVTVGIKVTEVSVELIPGPDQ